MRSGIVALVVTVAAGALAVIVDAARDERQLALTTGVNISQPVARLPPGGTACQLPLRAVEDFASVRFAVGTAGLPGAPLEVLVEPVRGGRPIARGRLGRGYPDRAQPSVEVGRVSAGRRVRVCVRNRGRRRTVAIFGGPGARRSFLRVDGRPQSADLWLELHSPEPRSALSLVPEMFRRAALFHPRWVEPWLFWLLGAGVVIGVPALLAAALARSRVGEGEPRSG
jgi:hypothetical protein